MIITKIVKLKIGGRNIKHFRKINPYYKLHQEIEVLVDQLSEGSNVKIDCICDICGKERNITYQKYKDSERLYNEYVCQQCSHIKRKKTNIEKYGCENYTNTISFKSKSSFTIKEKYGCENVFQSELIKSKSKLTNLSKYGVEYISQSPSIQKRIQKSSYSECEFNGLSYQGSYEKDFIDKYYNKIDIGKIDPISYFLDKNRFYFPDFFISNINLIIEVKSSYTFKLHKEKNIAKMNRCLELGYNFIFIIDKDYTELNKILNFEPV